jgi:hypothetical protein
MEQVIDWPHVMRGGRGVQDNGARTGTGARRRGSFARSRRLVERPKGSRATSRRVKPPEGLQPGDSSVCAMASAVVRISTGDKPQQGLSGRIAPVRVGGNRSRVMGADLG